MSQPGLSHGSCTHDARARRVSPAGQLAARRAGVFWNSIRRWASYRYGDYQYPLFETRSGPLRTGGIAGIPHHYVWKDGGIVPRTAAVVTIPIAKTLAIDLVGIPRTKNATSATLNVSLSWQFR